jgi:tetratricopeptide (TPR) repeat protein
MSNDLNTALQHHQSGRLEEAARLYQAILSADPHHADALHLLGVVAHQQRDQARAVELIGRAIAINPGVAAFHANLAEAFRTLGDLERAIGSCRTALRLDPNQSQAVNNLGLALLAQGKFAAAAEQFRAAVRLRPDHALFHNNLGTALRFLGETDSAVASFRQAVLRDPNLGESHANLGQLLLEQQNLTEAITHCREAVQLCTNLPQAHNNLGNVLREQGRLIEAKGCYAEALRLNPDLAMTYNNMGQAIQEEGKPQAALTWYRHALDLDAESPRIHSNLASALQELEQYTEARAHFEKALLRDPNYPDAHHGLANVLHELGHYAEAVRHHREALRLKPIFPAAHCDLGTVLVELSDFDEGLACFRAALRQNPRHAGAHAQIATVLRAELPEDNLAAMRQLLADSQLQGGKQCALHYGLAQVCDGRGAYPEAAENLRLANALCQTHWQKRDQNYDPSAHTRFVDRVIAVFTPDLFARMSGFGTESERPAFVVGLPRSGTTLVEQILASHSQVHGAGELRLCAQTFEALPRLLEVDAPPLECVGRLNNGAVVRAAQIHLDELIKLAPQALRIVDKMPDNYLYLGLLAILFPRARLIHCRRDLRDVAVSCWMTHFKTIRWACTFEHIANRFHNYQRLMNHWAQVLPKPILQVDYEDVVDDLEGSARRLVTWCGLEWEQACLAFHKARRPVRTASVTQVRKPIYRQSLARWKHYEQELADLFALLPPGNTSQANAHLP